MNQGCIDTTREQSDDGVGLEGNILIIGGITYFACTEVDRLPACEVGDSSLQDRDALGACPFLVKKSVL
jgi:hypothetical protein